MQRKDPIVKIKPPENSNIRIFCFKMMSNKWFEITIIALIFLNTLGMAFYKRGLSYESNIFFAFRLASD